MKAKNLFSLLLVVPFMISAGCGGGTGSTDSVTAPPGVSLVSISVTPSNPNIPDGATQQFTALGVLSDGTSYDITTQVTWSSSNTSVATITSSGRATAVGVGQTAIMAALSGKSGTATLRVIFATLSSIAITPENASVPAGTAQQFTATGSYSDGTTYDISTQITWASTTAATATITAQGLATAVAAGTTNISATLGSIQDTTTLTVTSVTLSSVMVSPTTASKVVGTTQQLTATCTYSDGTSRDMTSQATWSSSNTGVATVSTSGLVTAVSAGSASITASNGGKSGSASIEVTAATLNSIAVIPASPSIVVGATQQFTATGTYSDSSTHDITAQVTWSSSSTATATIVSSGLATGVAAGTATITATLGGKSGTSTLTITTGGGTVRVNLAWSQVTTNSDGSACSDLAGYKIYYGTTSGHYGTPVTVPLSSLSDPIAPTYSLLGLTQGVIYYIVATAFNTFGNESDYSNEVNGMGE
jgi:uncharacterized protein YjdB